MACVTRMVCGMPFGQIFYLNNVYTIWTWTSWHCWLHNEHKSTLATWALSQSACAQLYMLNDLEAMKDSEGQCVPSVT